MAYQDIIVFVDDGKANNERVDSALYLANLHNANLTVVALGSMKPIHAPDLDDEAEARMAKNMAESLVDEVVVKAKQFNITVEPIIIYGDITSSAETMAHYSRNHDLVMLAQPNPSRNNFQRLQSFAEDTLLLSGRPVLFMPYVGMRKTAISKVMKKVLIAWDGTPSACRALHDAIPILSHAKDVIILIVSSKKQKLFKTDILVDGLLKHLSNHDIKVRPLRISPGDNDVATVILNQITDNGIDLLVMGGYGTPKIRQKIFGGVSSTLLSSMPIPVLMSH